MPVRLFKEIEKIKKQILEIGARVEESLRKSVKSVERGDIAMAREVIRTDNVIDQMEVELEEEVLKVLALHQPVAIDLRYLIAVLKINNDLERIGDMSSNIANWTVFSEAQPKVAIPPEIAKMADVVQQMLKLSLDSLVKMDPETAIRVCKMDDEADLLHRDMYLRMQEAVLKSPDKIEPLVHLLGVSRNLERVGDLATNIAEDVVYTITGKIIRHSGIDSEN